MRIITPCTALILSALTATSAGAQALNSDEINDIFSKQVDAQKQPLTRSIGSAANTRGLSIVTVEDVVAEPVTTETATATNTTVQTAPAKTDPNTPLVYARLAPELQVNLNIKFDFDSAALTTPEKAKLSAMCQAMKQSDINQFRIIGHTDTSGSDAYNERLSVLRAKEVARHLVQDCGIEATRLETIGMGERFPLNEADTRADENRRVEFQALS